MDRAPAHSSRSAGSIFFGAIFGLIGVIILLVIELITTMLIYIYMNLNHVETFGWLVRFARSTLDLIASQIDYWLPSASNQAYATLLGELGPKSILLLMLGLVVGTLLRSVIGSIKTLFFGRD